MRNCKIHLTVAEGFFRTHRSYLVNSRHVKAVNSGGTGATLVNEQVITIARERKQDFAAFLRQISK